MISPSSKILLIDDDSDLTWLITEFLESRSIQSDIASSAHEGMKFLQTSDPDLILLDLHLPDRLGLDLIPEIRLIKPKTPLLILSAKQDAPSIVTAIKAGASDYLAKPFENEALYKKICENLELRATRALEGEIKKSQDEKLLMGDGSKMQQLIHAVSKVAPARAPVLLRGESGTGKSRVAELIHSTGPRKKAPFVSINCAAIPANLLESELFGHEKGAFTGASNEKMGKFEYAHTGTLFLDEIGELPIELQVKLLRVLQGSEFERVGGLKTIRVDVRIIAATNRNLEDAIEHNQFREDLFYRLNVLPIYMPSLREQPEEIPKLAGHFLKSYSAKAGKHFEAFSQEVLTHLIQHSWPGNVRELQNVIERAVVLGQEPHLGVSDFQLSSKHLIPRTTLPTPLAPTSLKDLEHKALMEALGKCGGNISQVSKTLGIGRETVYRRLKKYGVGLKTRED